MFDGRTTTFKPFEKKMIYDPVEGNHLLAKLSIYGIIEFKDSSLEHAPVMLADGGFNPVFQDFITQGLEALKQTLDGVVGQFKQMNNDREANKMARELPSKTIIDTCKELEWIDTILQSVNKEDYNLAEKYLSRSAAENASQQIEGAEPKIVQSPTGSKITGNRSYAKKGPGKVRAK